MKDGISLIAEIEEENSASGNASVTVTTTNDNSTTEKENFSTTHTFVVTVVFDAVVLVGGGNTGAVTMGGFGTVAMVVVGRGVMTVVQIIIGSGVGLVMQWFGTIVHTAGTRKVMDHHKVILRPFLE